MTNWFERYVLGRKPGKPRPRLKLDKWFMVFMALLLWSLGNILFQSAFELPYNLTNPQIWFKMLGIIIAIFGWVWLFKIYVASVREKQGSLHLICLECHKELEIVKKHSSEGVEYCPFCGASGIAKKTKDKGGGE